MSTNEIFEQVPEISTKVADVLSEEPIDEDDIVEPKALKPKQTLSEIHNQILDIIGSIQDNDKEIKSIDKKYSEDKRICYNEKSRLRKTLDDLLKQFTPSFHRHMVKTSKKRKTGNSGKGGFSKLGQVPKQLCEYLKIDETVLLSRPQVTHLLHDKFKEDKFKNGKVITITCDNAASLLGCEINHKIEFHEFQGFIKKFYDSEKQPTTV